MNDDFCIWLLTSSQQEDKETLHDLPLKSDRPVNIMGLEELFAKYGCKTTGGIERFKSIWDMWRWSIFRECLRRAQDAGELPDIIEHGSTWTIALSPLLYDITDLVEDDAIDATSVFLPRTLASCRPEDGQPHSRRYFALPFTVDCRLLFYREPLFCETDIHSWYSLKQSTPMLAKAKARFCVQMHDDAFHDALPGIWASGGDIVRANDLRVMIDAPESVEAMMRLVRLVKRGVAPRLDDAPDSLHNARVAMSEGRIHAGMSNNWIRNPFPTTAENFELTNFKVAMPPRDRERVAFVGGTNLGIVKRHHDNRDGQYEDALTALKFLCLDSYLIAYDPYKRFCVDLLATPAWKYNYQIGKLPPQITVLQQWQHQHQDEKFDMFMQALWSPDHLRLPSIAQTAGNEEYMKDEFRELWKALDSCLDKPDWESQCSGTIQKRFHSAAVRLRQSLDGIVRVRTREKGSQYFAERGLWSQVEATQQFREARYDILVDEVRQQYVPVGKPPQEFGAVPERIIAFLLAIVGTETGSLPLPYLPRPYLEELDVLVKTWRTLSQLMHCSRPATGGSKITPITSEQQEFLVRLAKSIAPKNPDVQLQQWFGITTAPAVTDPFAGMTAQTAQKHIASCCPEVLFHLAEEQHSTAGIARNHRAINDLTAELRSFLGGDAYLPTRGHRQPAALAPDLSICHLLAV